MNKNHPIITLTTDFGFDSHYVGQMKGAILSINPSVTIVDISHSISPQNILEGAMVLRDSARVFPEGTIHVVVIDPTVGTDREIVYIQCDAHHFVGPNNGVLSLAVEKFKVKDLRRIENKELMRPNVSATFHGRDIMAPVAAHLSKNAQVQNQLGPEIEQEQLVLSCFPMPEIYDAEVIGQVVFADTFGNLMTNISTRYLETFNQENQN